MTFRSPASTLSMPTVSTFTIAASSRLPPYGACLLGSINLGALVKDPFTPQAQARPGGAGAAGAARRAHARQRHRRLALSAAGSRSARPRPSGASGSASPGLADALIFCGVRYGSPEAVRLTREWLARCAARCPISPRPTSRPRRAASRCSTARAISPARRSQALPEEVRAAIARYGIRNALLNSIAPTGTISLLADNVSSGIEPVFAFSYVRHVLQPDGTRREESVERSCLPPVAQAQGRRPTPPPDVFVDAQTLAPDDHLAMQAAAQEIRRQLDLQDHQRAGATSPSRRSRTSTTRPMRWAARAARPTGPTR